MAKNLTYLLLTFGVSLIGCLILTPLVRSIARRWGLVDCPDGRRKVHAEQTALGGGLAIFASTLIAIGLALVASPLSAWLTQSANWLIGLFAAALVISFVGLLDDYRHLRGKHKLLGQILAASIVIGCGVQVRTIQFFEWRCDLGLLAMPFSLFLVLGAINSLNLIDGMDGLLSSVGLIICLAMGAMAFLTGSLASACVAMALAGALLGFLRYNFPPASIFMGDCGSMMVGLVVGVLAIQSSLKGPATVALAAPLAVLTLPIFDTLAAIVRRKLTGRSIYATDRGHLHHCLLRKGLTTARVLTCLSFLGLITLVGALASVALRNELFAVLSAGAVVAVLVAGRLFGYAEFLLLKNHLTASAGAFFRRPTVAKPHQVETHLQGSGDWGPVRRELTAYAIQNDLGSICLDVNAPAIQETYHARWTNELEDPSDFRGWRAEFPVVIGEVTLGRLEVTGRRGQGTMSTEVSRLAEVIENFELSLAEIFQGAFTTTAAWPAQSVVFANESYELSSAVVQQTVMESDEFESLGDDYPDKTLNSSLPTQPR